MSNMATFYDKFQDSGSRALNDWIRNFVNPYGSAFNTAHASFNDVLKRQKEADEAERQRNFALAMFALSFAGGSILTSVFGSAAVKTAAANVAIDVICRNEWEKAFKVAHFVSENKTAQFALGKFWDGGGSLLGDKVKKALSETPGNFPALGQFVQQPMNLQNKLDTWVRDLYAVMLAAGTDIGGQYGANDPIGMMKLTELLLAPFCVYAPPSSIDEKKVAIEIELSFFMKYVTEIDYLEKGSIRYINDKRWEKKVNSRTQIDAAPGSKDYPKGQQGAVGYGDYEVVAYQKIGDVVRTHIDKLNKSVFQEKFFREDEKSTMAMVQRAYANLEALGNRNRSQSALKRMVPQH